MCVAFLLYAETKDIAYETSCAKVQQKKKRKKKKTKGLQLITKVIKYGFARCQTRQYEADHNLETGSPASFPMSS